MPLDSEVLSAEVDSGGTTDGDGSGFLVDDDDEEAFLLGTSDGYCASAWGERRSTMTLLFFAPFGEVLAVVVGVDIVVDVFTGDNLRSGVVMTVLGEAWFESQRAPARTLRVSDKAKLRRLVPLLECHSDVYTFSIRQRYGGR